MNLCPLLVIANKSFNPKKKITKEDLHCEGKNCTWYDQQSEKCKLINTMKNKEYVMKSFNFI